MNLTRSLVSKGGPVDDGVSHVMETKIVEATKNWETEMKARVKRPFFVRPL